MILAATLGGCSIHPLPENVTALDTRAISQKIQCEAQDALKYQVEYLLAHDTKADDNLKNKWIRYLYEDIDQFPKLKHEKRFTEETLKMIDKYSRYLIYLDFTFTIYEENNNSTEINLLAKFISGSTALNLKANNNRKRQSLRNFRIRNTFQEIIANRYCKASNFSTLGDPLYPITGEIGMFELIDTFLKLNEYGSLSTNTAKDKVNLFADTLSFSTIMSGTAGPKVTIAPIGKAFQLADAGLVSANTRSDIHEVLIGMSLPSDDPKDPGFIARRQPFVGLTEKQTEQAINGDRLDEYLNEQIRRNLIINLGAQRAAAVNLLP